MAVEARTHSKSAVTLRYFVLGAIALLPAFAWGRGPSPYIPMDIDPRMERQIERVLLLAGKPIMRRPIAAAVVLDALPHACEADRLLCEEVRSYLDRYMNRFGVTHARVSGAITSGDSSAALPNSHGESVDSAWRAAVSAYFQPTDYLIVSAGGIAYDGEAMPTGSMISVGFDWAQLDIGYRDHWLGPMSDSSSIISTEAPTMPSVTLSNYRPLTPLGLSYEVFAAEMSRQTDIAVAGGRTAGRPRLAGIQLAFEPVIGYAIAANRITQYGGGARGGRGFSDFWDALTTSSNEQDASGQGSSDVNRIASLNSSMLFPGPVPFAVRMEYAGEDNTYEGKLRFGRTIVSLGLDFPLLWNDFDATYEVSEFQNGWYVHHIYPEGPRNEGHVIGHWFADHRLPRDAIGGRSHMLRTGWRLPNGDYAQARFRTLDLDPRWGFDDAARPYRTMRMLEIDYATRLLGHPVNAQLEIGEDIFGDSFARVGAAFDFAPSDRVRGHATSAELGSGGTELFVDAGVQYSNTREILFLATQRTDTTDYEVGYHVGLGARRPVSARNDLGVRLEVDQVADRTLVSLRALDYRFRFGRKLAVGAFFGVGRYDISLDAHGYYMGAGLQHRDVLPGWDVGLDYRYHDKLNRDKGLPSDPESNPGLPRRYIDVHGISLYVSKKWK